MSDFEVWRSNTDASKTIDPQALLAMMAAIGPKMRRGGDPVIPVSVDQWWTLLFGRGRKRARLFMKETQHQRREIAAEMRSTGISPGRAAYLAREAIPRIRRPEDMPPPKSSSPPAPFIFAGIPILRTEYAPKGDALVMLNTRTDLAAGLQLDGIASLVGVAPRYAEPSIYVKAYSGNILCEMPKPKPYASREIQIGEPCPHCSVTVGEVLTSAPPRCPHCLGFLAPPLRMMGMDVKLDPSLPEGRIELRGAIVNTGEEEP